MNTQEITETSRSVLEQFGSIVWRFVSFFLGFIVFAIGSVLEDIIRHPDDYSDLEKKNTGERENQVFPQEKSSGSIGVNETKATNSPPSSPKTLDMEKREELLSSLAPSQQQQQEMAAAPSVSRSLSEPVPSSASSSSSSSLAESEESKGVVLKNLPWTIKYDDLHNLLHSFTHKPKSVRYVRNEKGRFSGIVMVKYETAEEAKEMYPKFQNLEVGGRVVSVEYKQSARKHNKMKEARRASVSQPVSPTSSRQATPSGSSVVSSEQSTPSVTPSTLTPVHTPRTTPHTSPTQPRREEPSSVAASESKAAAILPTPMEPPPFARPKSYSVSYPPSWGSSSSSSSSSGTSSLLNNVPLSSYPLTSSFLTSSYAQSGIRRRLSVSDSERALFVPSRQPAGPEPGTKGFSDQYKRSRKCFNCTEDVQNM